MKKISNNLTILTSNNFNDISKKIDLPFPFDKHIINLLKEENLFTQEYHYITHKDQFAFFIVYKMKLNIFTFGKLPLNINVKIIGFPCSISENGYYTNNEKMMLEYIKTIKGPKLILNVKETINIKDMTIGQTLPSCIFINNFKTIKEYLASLRSPYRRRLNKAINECVDIKIEKYANKCPKNIYDLYLATYNKSSYKLEKLERPFFDKIKADKIVFSKNAKPVGFVLLKKHQEKLYFMLCGMDYEDDTADLYYYMLYKIIAYAIEENCKIIDFGQTSEETKLKLGAVLEKRYFYAHHTNKVLNKLIKINKSLLEYKYSFQDFHVYKKEV